MLIGRLRLQKMQFIVKNKNIKYYKLFKNDMGPVAIAEIGMELADIIL